MTITQEPATVTDLHPGYVLVLPDGTAYADPAVTDDDTEATVYPSRAEADTAALALRGQAADFYGIAELPVRVVTHRDYLARGAEAVAWTDPAVFEVPGPLPGRPERITHQFAVQLPNGTLYRDADTWTAEPRPEFTSYPSHTAAAEVAEALTDNAAGLGLPGWQATVVARDIVTRTSGWYIAD